MRRRHPLPKIWLMTDPRFGNKLLAAVRKLPFGSGVIFRHYALEVKQRRELFRQVTHICRQRGHLVLLAGNQQDAMRWHADGFHQKSVNRSAMVQSAAVHDWRELARARRYTCDMILVSPIFSTKSHPDARPMGLPMLNRIAARAGGAKVIALGGITRQKAGMLNPRLVHGWAAIDGLKP